MTTNTITEQPDTTSKKRKRLTLEEQITRQTELLDKDKDSLAKKQKRLRSLNASKMNKDRKEAQKRRNSMLIQLGLFFVNEINLFDEEEGKDVKLEFIEKYIDIVEERISEEEDNFIKKYGNNRNTKEAKAAKKSVYDKYILLNSFKNMKENYLKYNKVSIIINNIS